MLSSYHAPFAIAKYWYTEKEKERIVFVSRDFIHVGMVFLKSSMHETNHPVRCFFVVEVIIGFCMDSITTRDIMNKEFMQLYILIFK